MDNFEQKITEFTNNAQKVLERRDFKDFSELETRFCTVLNEGIRLKLYLKDNPDLCDEATYRYISDQTADMSMIEDRYKFLIDLIKIRDALLEHYKKYVKFLVQQKKDYNSAIRIFNQMFEITNNYLYKKEIANIYFVVFRKQDQAIEMYKQIEPHMASSSHFWWEYSEIFAQIGDYFNQVLCMQKAIKLELERAQK